MGFDLPRSVDAAQAPTQHSEVYIEVGVRAAQFTPVRVVAAALAARADFDLDAVADLKMAVDEACSTLATLAPPDARLRCLLQVDPDQITVDVRVSSAPLPSVIPQHTFGWRVLVTLADEVEVLSEDGCGMGLRLVKVRRAGRA